LNLGLAVKNIGPQMKFEGPGLYRRAEAVEGGRPSEYLLLQAAGYELPALVEIGLSYDYKVTDNFVAQVNGSFSNNNLYFDSYSGGVELAYTVDDLKLFGRGGYMSVPQNTDNEIFGASMGAGISYNLGGVTLVLDYAYRSVEFFDANQVFSLKFEF
jgi:hypothetical protein